MSKRNPLFEVMMLYKMWGQGSLLLLSEVAEPERREDEGSENSIPHSPGASWFSTGLRRNQCSEYPENTQLRA